MVPLTSLRRAALALLLGTALASCGQQTTGAATSGKDALYFADSASGLPPIYVNEPYTATLAVAGGVGPYSLRLASGSLPPGVKLDASQRTLSGQPTKTGTYTFTLEVTDSTLSSKAGEYTLNVQELLPLAITPTLPSGEVRGETRIPLTITAPRGARAAHVSWTLPAGVQVTRIQNADPGGLLFWRQQGTTLLLDMGFRKVPRTGTRVALVTVKPTKAVTFSAGSMTVEARGADGAVVGVPNAAPATTPAEGTSPTTEPAPAETTTPTTTPTPTDPDTTDAAPAETPADAPGTDSGTPPPMNPPDPTPPEEDGDQP
ncbi:Ig domain-containing protein [uncultured Deinococcus sp.]|uniref:Ig domain-containing protein n=1 Tax=uncultured Deinococcus sp. TaxID=158789 RepID=UPI0025D7F8BF|nr:Ig domain-containing protein [uncultured Deinococcus sp.]